MNTNNLLLIICGVCIGILIALALIVPSMCGNESIIISTLDSDYEVIVNNFLGYEQLMVIKQL